ncbi:MAG: hypothetical protein AAFO91_05820, partial [Bacteroidota bacterium]
NPGSIPTKVYEPPISSITLEDLDEGVQYFHLQMRNAEGWGRVTHFRLGRDSQPPERFSMEVMEQDVTNPAIAIKLDITDGGSGIERYQISIDGAEAYDYIDETGSSTITLPELSPGAHSVVIEAFDYAGNSIVATKTFTIAAFEKPVFTEYPTELNAGVIPVIRGATRPDALVAVSVRTLSTGSQMMYEVLSDSNGVFTVIPDAPFELGTYELMAVAVDQFGAQSEESDVVRMAVQQSGYLAVGSWAVSILSIIIPLIALLGFLVLMVLYFIRRTRVIGVYVSTETKEALSVVEREFNALKQTVQREESVLVESRPTKKLTKAESDLLKVFCTQLNTAERAIKKEVSDVDDIVE